MNACGESVDRLYDEDARLALAGSKQLPEDMAAHASECADCRRAWDDARADSLLFGAGLIEAAPLSLEQRASRALCAALPGPARTPLIDWGSVATWAAAATALSAEVARQGLEGEGT
jgi:hypothetical protein